MICLLISFICINAKCWIKGHNYTKFISNNGEIIYICDRCLKIKE